MLLSYGAPLIPAGGSCCNLLKSLISLFLAGVDILLSLYLSPLSRKPPIPDGKKKAFFSRISNGVREIRWERNKKVVQGLKDLIFLLFSSQRFGKSKRRQAGERKKKEIFLPLPCQVCTGIYTQLVILHGSENLFAFC